MRCTTVTPSTTPTMSASFVAPSVYLLYLILCLVPSVPLSHGIHFSPFLPVHSFRDYCMLPLLDHPSFSMLRLQFTSVHLIASLVRSDESYKVLGGRS
ncbi:hypothetical protein BDN70DRAFT_235707 [Pholiota conissans]|uniref:Uncharacterized protein n=1 Tax=Pholiota conissans TaxID=109636 RepID=A0A9P6D0A4_9AGAR|nr:hypothetical protein BDN70DRAFT_235707 [Pholiota conissans]